MRDERIKFENRNKIKRTDKNKERENKDEIEKFQDICINFYSSGINKNNTNNSKHRNSIFNTNLNIVI